MSIYHADYKMEQNEFLKSLQLLSTIKVRKYSPKSFNELFIKGKLNPVENTLVIYESVLFFDKSPINYLKDVKNWSTYTDCSKLKLHYVNNEECKLSIKIYDGDLLDGDPVDDRWSCDFIIPVELAYQLYHDNVLTHFKIHLQKEYQLFLKEQERNFCNELAQSILSTN